MTPPRAARDAIHSTLAALSAPVLAAGCVALPARPALAAAGDTAGPPCEAIQFVAHPDDDLLFLNPDIDSQVASGRCSVTVYVTAGNLEPPVQARQRGELDAYRAIAGVQDEPDQTEWDSRPLTVGGVTVERFALHDRPTVQLIFLNLDDARVSDLTAGRSINIIDPATDVASGERIDVTGVRRVMAGLMAQYRVTTVRTQDPVPDSRYSSHSDHTATAALVRAATHDYHLQSGTAASLVYSRDYDITNSPANLSPAVAARKRAFFMDQYVPQHPIAARDAAGRGWTERAYYRWPRGTSWVGRDSTGYLRAFAVLDGGVFEWRERDSGTWSGPTSLGRPGEGLYPAISVASHADGRLRLVARGTDHRILTAAQTSPAGSWSDWVDLGNPSAGARVSDQLGTPAVALNEDGRMQVFVRNGGRALSTRREAATGDSWDDWVSLGGENLQDPVAVVARGTTLEVFASTDRGLAWWHQSEANSTAYVRKNLPATGMPASPPAVGVTGPDGRIEVQVRTTGGDLTALVGRADGTWDSSRPAVGSPGGIGQPSLLAGAAGTPADRFMAAARNAGGGVSIATQGETTLAYGAWQDLGGQIVDYPVLATDHTGRAVACAIGLDGRLWTNRQLPADQDLSTIPTSRFAGWSTT